MNSILAKQVASLKRETIPAILRVITLLVVFVMFNLYVEQVTRLPASSYQETVLVYELIQRIGWPMIVGGIIIAGLLARFGGLLSPWSALEIGGQLRVFVVFLAAIMAWSFSTMGYNYFFDQGYYAERLLLILLLPLLWWRPVFVFPFVLIAYLMLWQLGEPSLGGSIFPHKLQVLRAINLFAVAFIVYAATGYRRANTYLLLTCCLVAASYWLPALAKMELSWLSDGRVHIAPLSAYAHGWLTFLPPDQIVEFVLALKPFDLAARVFVIVIESLCLIFLWRRSLSLFLLGSVIVFHTAVFIMYGFLFWTWILLDAALFVLLLRTVKDDGVIIYNFHNFVISVFLIGFGGYWAKPPKLGWYDTPLTYTYRIEAIDEYGIRTLMHPESFTPYEDVITMGSFSYLVPDRTVLVGTYGVTTDRDIAVALSGADSAEDVFALERQNTDIVYDAARATRLYGFLERYVSNRAADNKPFSVLRSISPPPQFWSYNGDQFNFAATPIRELRVTEFTTFFDGERLKVIRKRELIRLPIPRKAQP